jgi:hypothetical protein
VRKALGALDGKYRGFNWEDLGADGDADAIEGAMYLYNREPVPSAAAWMDYQIKWMWSKQDSAHRPHLEQWRGRGVVEGWYGDGNFNRTSLMYAMWKTQGVSAHPWRADLRYGAERRGDSVFVIVEADSAWNGALHFDTPRHREVLHLPWDWPRINSFPEWYTVDSTRTYRVRDLRTGASESSGGDRLASGLPVHVARGAPARLIVTSARTSR